MALSDLSKTFISLKKLSGKAHTSNEKELYNEALPTGVTLSSNTIFGEAPPPGIVSPFPYKVTGGAGSTQYSGGIVEFLRLPVSFIAGTDTASGRHGFEIKLPSNYEAESDNPLAGTYPFKNSQSINITSGSLQLIPPSFAPDYEAKPYYGTIGSGSLIPVADARDWNLDYFNGILFQQDPPGTGAHAENPDYIEAYLYIGDFLDSIVSQTGDITGVTAGTGLSGGGGSGAVTLDLDVDGLSALGGTSLHQTQDHFIFSDNGTEKKITFSNLEDAIFGNVTGDATIAAGGALTIGGNAVEGSMINANAAGDGLVYASNALKVDLNELTAAAVDVANDSIAIIDATDNSSKKESIADVITAAAGAGLAATSGVLSVGVDDTGIEINSDALRLKDSGVTLTKMANLADMKVIGNVSGGAAGPAAIAILDEDNMASNSSTSLATQQSIKAYVDSVAAGLDPKDSVMAATVASFTMASTASGSTLVLADGEGGFNATADTLTIDAISVTAGSRVLIKDGVNSNSAGVHNKWNGIYTVGALNGATLTLTRADDADQGDITGGAHVFVEQGTVNGDTGYVCTNDGTITVGTTAITWSQFSGPGVFSAGDGLDLTGKVFSLDLKTSGGIKIDSTELAVEPANFAGTGLEDDGSDNLRISAAAAGSGLTGGGGSALAVDLNELSAADVDMANDSIAIVDATDNSSKKESIADIITATAGSGLVATAGVLSVDIDELSALGGTGLHQTQDHFIFSDNGTEKKITFSNLEDAIFGNITGDATIAAGGALTIGANAVEGSMINANAAGDGLAYASNALKLDLNELTAATVDMANDSIAIIDANDSNASKKESIVDIMSSAAGTGLGASAGVINVDYAGADSIIKAAADGTSGGGNITVASGDLVLVQDITDGNVKYVAASQLPGGSGSGNIGAAEDGDYTDGLFTDFTTSTAIGTPIDRFNEILKLLVPAPAPDLDDIDSNVDGVDVKLAFGTSNDQSAASPPYISVAASAGIAAAVDVNGDYATATSSNNLRVAVFNGSTDIIGDLNEDIAADVTSPSSRTNYPANSFGNAQLGSLILEVNGSTIHTVSLTSASTGTGSPGSGTDNEVDGDGSGFINISATSSGQFDNGTTFDNFKHRTGQFKVAAASQRNGWNYARVKHNNGSTTVTTNYIEWVNDNNSSALAAGSNSLAYAGVGTNRLSGITYNASGTGRYQVTVTNAYKYVYDSTATSFTTSNSGTTSGVSYAISSIAKASINTGGGESHTKQIVVDETDNITANYILGGSITAGVNVSHPIKSNLSNAGQASAAGILLYNVSESATVTSEPFVSETYRIISGSYANQSDAASGNAWNSATTMVGGDAGHNTGLQVYRERLYSPKNTLNTGDFRNSGDGGSLANGPAGNPNYSGISGTRVYYRKFQNAGSSVRDFSYTITGDATLVGAGDSVGTNKNFKLSFRMPSDGSGNVTGYLDAKNAFSFGTTTDGAGGAIGSVDTSTSMTNNISFGTVEVGTNEFIVARIEADSNWSGYLENFAVSFGAVGSVSASPAVGNIDSNQSGVNGKLSFGDTLTKSGYNNVETTAGSSEVNANGAYSLSGIRRGVFNGSTVISGEINETTNASGNAYPANAFGGGSANTGTLKLEVNGSVIHSVNLASFTSGNSLNSNGSGFSSLLAATAGLDSSSLPDFTKFYRTGGYQVGTADQRSGWNYARVIHTISATDHASTYVEWVNDDASRTIAFSGVSIDTFAETGSAYNLSGIKYFVSPTAKFKYRVADIYKHIYSTDADAIDYPVTTNSTITSIACAGGGIADGSVSSTSRSLPSLSTGVSGAYNLQLNVTGSFTFDQSSSLPGETAHIATLQGRINHPLAGDSSTSSTSTVQWLVFTDADNSTVLVENFKGESKRLQKANAGINNDYDSQSDVYTGGSFVYPWNSQTSLNGGTASHNTGLMIYNNKLVSPQKAGHASQLGDFRGTVDNGSSNIISPTGNPNYNSLSNATRDYVRYFQNNTGATKYNFSIVINGTGTIVNSSTSLSGNRFRVFIKLPQTSTSTSTGFLDLAVAFANGQYADNDGCFTGSFDSSLNATNTGTFGVQGVGDDDYVIIKIVADKTWTGNISSITFSWS